MYEFPLGYPEGTTKLTLPAVMEKPLASGVSSEGVSPAPGEEEARRTEL